MYTKYILQTTDSSRYFIYNLIKAGLRFLFQCNQNIPLVKFSHLANTDSRNEEYTLLLYWIKHELRDISISPIFEWDPVIGWWIASAMMSNDEGLLIQWQVFTKFSLTQIRKTYEILYDYSYIKCLYKTLFINLDN